MRKRSRSENQSPATTPDAQSVQATASVELERPILPAEMNPYTLVKQTESTNCSSSSLTYKFQHCVNPQVSGSEVESGSADVGPRDTKPSTVSSGRRS
jgi:hypothetical protein